MRMTVELFALQSSRIRRVLEYLDAHLDEDIPLARLADLACLSPSQLDRLYRSKVRETPMATLRRLRLKRALAQIRGGGRNLLEIGQFAGYGSAAAFTHAFVRQFGCAPSQAIHRIAPEPVQPEPYLERVPERPVYQLEYRGRREHQRDEVGLLVGSLAVAGARRWRTWMALDRDRPLQRDPRDQVDMVHFVPSADQPQGVGIVDRAMHAGGLYAVQEVLGYPRAAQMLPLAEKVRQNLGCVPRDDARILVREITVSGYTAPCERRFALYLPVTQLHSTRRRHPLG